MEEQRPKRISRTELYARVWQTPMTRLGLQLGISGNGLAKICQRLDVPYPPRGYWAKKEAGKAVSVTELPQLQPGTPTDVDIYPSPSRPQEPAPIQAVIAAAEASASAVTIPETLEGAHPKVKAWLAQHKSAITSYQQTSNLVCTAR